MNTSPLGRLTQNDFVRGAVTALAGGALLAVGTILHGLITAPGFDVFMLDWGGLLHDTINAAIIGAEGGFGGYILKNLMTNQEGNIPALGKAGELNK